VADDRWIVIPNWERFQHYKDRDPPWIKLHRTLASDPEWLALSGHRRALLISLWLEYASTNGRVKLDTHSISRRVNLRVTRADITSLVHAGLIGVSASKPLATRYHDLALEAEAEKKERNKQRKKSNTVDNGGVAVGAQGTRAATPAGHPCPHCGIVKAGPAALADHVANVHYDHYDLTH
jgi:hypothetical protein